MRPTIWAGNTDSSRPYRSQNNAIVERMVRHLEEGPLVLALATDGLHERHERQAGEHHRERRLPCALEHRAVPLTPEPRRLRVEARDEARRIARLHHQSWLSQPHTRRPPPPRHSNLGVSILSGAHRFPHLIRVVSDQSANLLLVCQR